MPMKNESSLRQKNFNPAKPAMLLFCGRTAQIYYAASSNTFNTTKTSRKQTARCNLKSTSRRSAQRRNLPYGNPGFPADMRKGLSRNTSVFRFRRCPALLTASKHEPPLSVCKPYAALSPATGKHLASIRCAHTFAETMLPGTLTFFRLISPFHYSCTSLLKLRMGTGMHPPGTAACRCPPSEHHTRYIIA